MKIRTSFVSNSSSSSFIAVFPKEIHEKIYNELPEDQREALNLGHINFGIFQERQINDDLIGVRIWGGSYANEEYRYGFNKNDKIDFKENFDGMDLIDSFYKAV